MGELIVTLKTLTPLWTGGIDGTMDRIHETGLVGSLRWWYEAIVRGLGGRACDPSTHTCSFDADKYRRSNASDERQRLRDAGLCDVCQVFGATGWKRRFRLEIAEDKTKPAWEPRDKAVNVRPPKRSRGWYLLPGHVGEITLGLQGDRQAISMLASLFLWLERWGSLGARPQLGYGAFRILNRGDVMAKAGDWRWSTIGANAPLDTRCPDLRCFLFFRYTFSPPQREWWTGVPGVGCVKSLLQPLVDQWHTVPTTPALKNEWRFNRWKGSRGDEIKLFGTLHPDRRRGRIGVTWAYRENGMWHVHGWAWMPCRKDLADRLWEILADPSIWDQVLGVKGNLEVFPSGRWQELKSGGVQELLQR